MIDNNLPYGPELNPVGDEFNADYISNVQGSRGTYKSNDNNQNQQTLETSSSVSGSSEAAQTAGSTAVGTSTTTTTIIATATGGVVVGGIVIGVITIGGVVANIFANNFSYDYFALERKIEYGLQLEFSEDNDVYVQLLDSNKNEVDLNEHEIVLSDAYMIDDKSYIDISGFFYEIEYDKEYFINAYAFDKNGQQFSIYESTSPLVITSPTFGLTDISVNSDPERKIIRANATLFYNQENQGREVSIVLLDENGSQVNDQSGYIPAMPIEEGEFDNYHFKDYGNGVYGYTDGYTFKGLTSGKNYTIEYREVSYDQTGAPSEEYEVLETRNIYLEEADNYLPYLSFIYSSSNVDERSLIAYYDYASNDITYDNYFAKVENINGTDTLSEQYVSIQFDPENGINIPMEGSSGFNYKISLYGNNNGSDTYTLLIQNAIYY